MDAFPVYLRLGPLVLHPHLIFEIIAYLAASRVYVWARARLGDPIAPSDRSWVMVAAILGGAVGSKLLYWVSDPWLTLDRWQDPFFLMGGKSVVGGLVGGLIAVEWGKRRLGITQSIGDLFAIPLAVGIGIGRIGCFLTGLDDHTHGIATSLPWAVDFGDGVSRHPTQLYEIAFVWALAVLLGYLIGRPHRQGDAFRVFMVAYLGFRFLLEFIKPGVALAGLNAIQWVCLAMLFWYGQQAWSRARQEVAVHG